MKSETTRKRVMEDHDLVVEVGYCRLCHLLRGLDPDYFTSGIYGWNADVHEFGATAIVTGYRPFGNFKPDRELLKKYDDLAKESLTTLDRRDLLLDFLETCRQAKESASLARRDPPGRAERASSVAASSGDEHLRGPARMQR